MMALLLRKYWLPLLLVALGLAATVACYRSGHKAGSASVQAQWDRAKLEQRQVVDKAKERDLQTAHQASTEYQTTKAQNAEKTRIVRETVVRTVTGPCLDADGLRHVNAAISAVPAASAAH